MIDQISQTNKAAQAMANQKAWYIRLTLKNHVEVDLQRMSKIVKSFYISPCAARFAVSDMIDTVHCQTSGNKILDNIFISSAMFGQSVDDQ